MSALKWSAIALVLGGCCNSAPYEVTFERTDDELDVSCDEICEHVIASDLSGQEFEIVECEDVMLDGKPAAQCTYLATSCTTELH